MLEYTVRYNRSQLRFPWTVSDKLGHEVSGATKMSAVNQYLLLYGDKPDIGINYDNIEKKGVLNNEHV